MLIQPNNCVELAEMIEKLSTDADLRGQLGSAGRAHALKNFSIDKNVAAHEDLYTQIAAGNSFM